MKPADFIAIIAPIAVELRLEGSPIFPSVRIAQAGLETGWNIPPWNNLGGYKAGAGKPNQYWKGKVVYKGTWEVYDGKRVDVTAAFRAYDSVEDFFRDQDLLFENARYDRVRLATMPEQQADMLQACGYATDPAYATKLKRIIDQYDLTRYDLEAEVQKSVIEGLRRQVEQLAAENKRLQQRVEKLENRAKMVAVPDWAKEAVDAAVKTGIVDTPEGGSYDFYRLLVVMHRVGLIPKQNAPS